MKWQPLLRVLVFFLLKPNTFLLNLGTEMYRDGSVLALPQAPPLTLLSLCDHQCFDRGWESGGTTKTSAVESRGDAPQLRRVGRRVGRVAEGNEGWGGLPRRELELLAQSLVNHGRLPRGGRMQDKG